VGANLARVRLWGATSAAPLRCANRCRWRGRTYDQREPAVAGGIVHPQLAPPLLRPVDMRLTELSRRLTALAAVSLVLLVVFYFAVRPWYRAWGATEAEVHRALPGDGIVLAARANDTSTRAITIEAPIREVWPWVAQLGQDRGGFYSFELLEDLAGAEMENADRVRPEWQHWNVGDKLWMAPPHKFRGQGYAVLLVLRPGRALGFATRQIGTPATAVHDGSWSFALEPSDDTTTRLLVRGRAGGSRGWRGSTFDRFIFEPIHFVMERRMMEGIKARVERRPVSEATDVAHVVLWAIAFGLVVTSTVLVFRQTYWTRPLVVFAGSALTFQELTLGQPPLVFGMVLVVALAALLWPSTGVSRPRRRTQPSRRPRLTGGSVA
jgi:hypothetical protein